MRIVFLLLVLFVSFRSNSQDSAMLKMIDRTVERIKKSRYLMIFEDTVGFYGSDDATTVKGFHTDTYYYDSLNRLIKVVSKRPWSPNTYFFSNNLLIKAVVYWFWEDGDYVNNRGYGHRRVNVKEEVKEYYYSKEDNDLNDKTINELIIAHPERKEFLANLSIGIGFIKQSLSKH